MTDEMITIRNRIVKELYGGMFAEDVLRNVPRTFPDYNSMVEGEFPGTYKWNDIEYAAGITTRWKSADHLGRLLYILQQAGPEYIKTDEGFRECIIGAVRYWTTLDLHNPNWWYNEIGIPRSLADITLLCFDYMSDDLKEKVIGIIKRGSMRTNPAVTRRTGANLVWGAAITIRLALIADDESLIKEAAERISRELVIGKEGIQKDGSFFQHGPRVYSGGYGRSFVCDMAQICLLFSGTSYQFSDEKLELLTIFVLDGLRHMTHFGTLDYQVVGREYTRKGMLKTGALTDAVKKLVLCEEMPRREELKAYCDTMTNRAPFAGTKYFPTGAMLCHHTNGLYVGTKGLTPKTLDEEICNNEGVLGYNMSYGSHLCIMKNGDEYLTMPAVWRYDRIPGTTSRTETDSELLAHDTAWSQRPLPNDICGGGQPDSDTAYIHEKAEHDTVSAYTADFAFPGGFVHLVCGIEDSESLPLTTTVQQCKYSGEIFWEGNSLISGGIRYTPLDGTCFNCAAEEKTGSWSRCNLPASAEAVTDTVLTITVEHKAGTVSSCAFMYSDADFKCPEIRVLSNTVKEQSVLLSDGRILKAVR